MYKAAFRRNAHITMISYMVNSHIQQIFTNVEKTVDNLTNVEYNKNITNTGYKHYNMKQQQSQTGGKVMDTICYELRSYDGTITKKYDKYGWAHKAAIKLIAKDIYCGIWALVVNKNEDGTDDIDSLRWEQVIGC